MKKIGIVRTFASATLIAMASLSMPSPAYAEPVSLVRADSPRDCQRDERPYFSQDDGHFMGCRVGRSDSGSSRTSSRNSDPRRAECEELARHTTPGALRTGAVYGGINGGSYAIGGASTNDALAVGVLAAIGTGYLGHVQRNNAVEQCLAYATPSEYRAAMERYNDSLPPPH